MTHLDLCSGIGGFHLAAEWAGFETVGLSEIEPYCCRLLAEKWPEIKNYGDLRTADFSGLRGRISVLSAGVPCQPSSLAGKRRGACDDRWLWEAVLDVVERVEPAWCIFENPVGILTLGEFGGILLRLESFGYAVRAFSVSANAVGAKHRRQRVFIVAHAGSIGQRTWSPERIRENGSRASGKSGGTSGDAEALADADNSRGSSKCAMVAGETEILEGERDSFRLTEPPLCLRTDGIRGRSYQLKALGNAVVPQQAFPFFEAIAQVECKQLGFRDASGSFAKEQTTKG